MSSSQAVSQSGSSDGSGSSLNWSQPFRWMGRLPAPVDETDSVRSMLQASEEVRVIVYLDTPTLAEHPRMGTFAIKAQRTQIADAQDRVIRSLGIDQKSMHRRFKTIPAFAMSVDRHSLARLGDQPEVMAIVRDTAVPPILDGTVPIIEADQMHELGWTGLGHAVAILDTGVDRDHPMFLDDEGQSRVVSEACFSSNSSASASLCPDGSETQFGIGAAADCSNSVSGCGHGTHVAGIAAGSEVTQGGVGFSGVAPEADIIAIQVFSQFTPAACESSSPCVMSYSSDQVAALEWLLDQDQSRGGPWQVASANMSLGGGRYTGYCDTATVAPAIRNLKNIGIATAIASGNSGYSDSISSPACVSAAISVGATTNSDLVAFYTSASASLIDVYAPGSFISSAASGGGYVSFSGTSMAAPHVAGAWAVMKQAGVGDDSATGVELIETALKETGKPISARQTSSGSSELGYSHPRIALKQALDRTDSTDDWLTVRQAGQGQGRVISSPSGIDCGDQCSMVVMPGDVVVLQATADEGSEFVGFEGCSSVIEQQCTIEISGSTSITVTFAIAPPSNDDFADAKILTGISIAESFSTVGATDEVNEPLPTCDTSGRSSVWFAWRLPDDGLPSNVRVDTIGSEFDTVLDVFTGTTLTDLDSLDCDFGTFDANWTDATVSFEAVKDTTYFFRITGYFATAGNAKLNLTLSALTYDLEVAIDGAGQGEVIGSGIQCGNGGTDCSEVYTVEDLISLSAIPTSASEFDGWTGDCASFAAGSNCELMMVGPKATTAFFKTKLPNDNLDAATPFALTLTDPFEAEVDLSLASGQAGEVISACGAIQSSVWYVWTAPSDVSSQPVTLDLSQSDSGFDVAVAVFTSSTSPPTYGSLNELDCYGGTSAGTESLFGQVVKNRVSVFKPNKTIKIKFGGLTQSQELRVCAFPLAINSYRFSSKCRTVWTVRGMKWVALRS